MIEGFAGAYFAAEINRNGNTRSAFIVERAVRILSSETPASSIPRRLRSSARAPSFFSSMSRSKVAFLSAPSESATSHVSGVSSVFAASLSKMTFCASSFGRACDRNSTSRSLTAPSLFHLASWYSLNFFSARASPTFSWAVSGASLLSFQ